MAKRPLLIIFSNLGLGGVQKKIVDIVNYLADKSPNLPITIFLRRKEKYDLSGQIKNRRVKVIVFSKSAKTKSPFLFSLSVINQIWQTKPRAILAFLSPFGLPAILAKFLFFWRKVIVVVNEDHYSSGIIPTYKYSLLNRLGMMVFYRGADKIISPTGVAKEDLIKNFFIPAGKIEVVDNWTNLAGKKIIKTVPQYDLIYAGRFTKVKRVDFLLKATAEFKKIKKNIRVCLLGDGPEVGSLKRLASQLGIKNNVYFLGIHRKVEDFLIKSKLFVCFSQYGAEGFPLAVLEAMAVGTPVVSFRFAGSEEIIKDWENGVLFDSIKDFIEKASILLASQPKRKKIAQNAQNFIKENHSLRNIERYISALKI